MFPNSDTFLTMGFSFSDVKSVEIKPFCALTEGVPVPDLTAPVEEYLPGLYEWKPFLPEVIWRNMNWNLSEHPNYKSKTPFEQQPEQQPVQSPLQHSEEEQQSVAIVNSTSSRNRVVISLTTSPERMWEVSWLLFLFLRL